MFPDTTTTETNSNMKTIFSATITSATVSDVPSESFYAESEEEITHMVAEFCRSRWVRVMVGDEIVRDPPSDDDECVELFFEDNEDHTLTRGQGRLRGRAGEDPTHEDVAKALTIRDFVTSFADAVRCAGGTGWSWEESSRMTLGELAAVLAPNGVRFTHDPGSVRMSVYDKMSRAVAAARPFLKHARNNRPHTKDATETE